MCAVSRVFKSEQGSKPAGRLCAARASAAVLWGVSLHTRRLQSVTSASGAQQCLWPWLHTWQVRPSAARAACPLRTVRLTEGERHRSGLLRAEEALRKQGWRKSEESNQTPTTTAHTNANRSDSHLVHAGTTLDVSAVARGKHVAVFRRCFRAVSQSVPSVYSTTGSRFSKFSVLPALCNGAQAIGDVLQALCVLKRTAPPRPDRALFPASQSKRHCSVQPAGRLCQLH